MKSIEDVFSYLEGIEEGEDFAAAIRGELSKKNNEAQNLRKRTKSSEEAQRKLGERIAKVAEKLDLDFDAEDLDAVLDGHANAMKDLKTQLAAAMAANSADPKADPESAKLIADLAKATEQLTALQKQADKEAKRASEFESKYNEEHGRRLNTLKQQAVVGALSESNAVKPAQLVKILLPNVKIEEGTENLLFVKDDGDEVSLTDGIKEWLGANPEFVLDNQNPGAGSGTNKGGSVKTITRAQLSDPAFYRQHQKEILAGELQVAD